MQARFFFVSLLEATGGGITLTDGYIVYPSTIIRLKSSRAGHSESFVVIRSRLESSGVFRSHPETSRIVRSHSESSGICQSHPRSKSTGVEAVRNQPETMFLWSGFSDSNSHWLRTTPDDSDSARLQLTQDASDSGRHETTPSDSNSV